MKLDYKALVLPPKYAPKKTDEYMNDEHKAFFYQMLSQQKAEIESETQMPTDIVLGQKMDSVGAMDDGDAATMSTDTDMAIRMQERWRDMLAKIDAALARLENGTFGYSVLSGCEIGLKRLIARPIATVTLEEQEEKEK